MNPKSLPQPGPTARPDDDSAQRETIRSHLKNLSRSLSTLENGIRNFSNLDPSEAIHGFNLARGELATFKKSVQMARIRIQQLFRLLAAQSLLENPKPLDIPFSREPIFATNVVRRLTNGVGHSRDALGLLLKNGILPLKAELVEDSQGFLELQRLATLLPILGWMEFGSSEEGKAAILELRKFHIHPQKEPQGPKTPKRKIRPIGKEAAQAFSDLLKKERSKIPDETRFQIALKILEKSADKDVGVAFEDLRTCFEGMTNQRLKKELETLRQEAKHFNLTLTGSFEPRGRPSITFKIPDQQDPSTQSIN